MIIFQPLTDDAIAPFKRHQSDAGFDLHAIEDAEIGAGMIKLVRTGIAVAIPEGHVGFITPRSGLAAKHGITVLNAPGTIDAGYRGELKVLLHYAGHRSFPLVPAYQVLQGDRIAQLVVMPICQGQCRISDELPPADRGNNGFGSTGR